MKHYHKNPRQISEKQFNQLQGWLEEYGDLSGIVHNIRTDEIVGGNQRSEAMHFMNGTKPIITHTFKKPTQQGTIATGYFEWKGERISYRQVKWTDKKAEKANMIANKAGGTFDFDIMANLWDVPILLETGWDEKELQLGGFEFENTSQDAPEDIDTERAQEYLKKWKVKAGDLFHIAGHRLLCGDSTDAELLKRLFDGDTYDSMITDPPFFTPATHYQSRVKHQRKFSDLSSLASFWELVMNKTDVYRKHEAHAVVFCNCDSYAVFYPVMFSRFDKTKSLVWDKKHVGLGRIFRHQHELMIWGRNEGHYFMPDGDLRADVIPCEATPSKSRDHPVEKPVALYEELVKPLTPKGGITFDPFAGAGRVLVAAENHGCKSYAMDLDPAYVAVALERMSLAFPALQIRKMK